MQLNMKEVDADSLQVEGVNRTDYPDLCDSFFSFGLYKDGTEMTPDELDELGQLYPHVLHNMAHESLI